MISGAVFNFKLPIMNLGYKTDFFCRFTLSIMNQTLASINRLNQVHFTFQPACNTEVLIDFLVNLKNK